jgi:hypothetical protein
LQEVTGPSERGRHQPLKLSNFLEVCDRRINAARGGVADNRPSRVKVMLTNDDSTDVPRIVEVTSD